MSAAPPAIEMTALRHAYGKVVAVDGVGLAIAAGEIMALVGPSGCGKSTLLRLAAGLEALQHGQVRMSGALVADSSYSLPPEKRAVGLVFQDLALFPHLDILDNVSFGLAMHGGAANAGHARALLERLGVAHLAASYPHMLSGGQQQRVALARALAPKPRILLLDEAFSSLDARLRGQVRDETLALLRERRVATMIVTHDPEEALAAADRVALMHGGRLVQTGTPRDLYFRPVNALAAEFFGAINRLRGVARNGAVPSPFGPLPASSLADGQAADILIRPEALKLRPPGANGAGAGVQARVKKVRILGPGAMVDLALQNGGGPAMMVHVSSRQLPEDGAVVAVGLDEGGALVFPAPAGGGGA
jgi:iron(III) transport system ATP-binding protein